MPAWDSSNSVSAGGVFRRSEFTAMAVNNKESPKEPIGKDGLLGGRCPDGGNPDPTWGLEARRSSPTLPALCYSRLIPHFINKLRCLGLCEFLVERINSSLFTQGLQIRRWAPVIGSSSETRSSGFFCVLSVGSVFGFLMLRSFAARNAFVLRTFLQWLMGRGVGGRS